jgi:hypothetical protein
LSRARRPWPGGARFAFTICDDTDNATVANVEPVYELLADLGLCTTKTVWVFPPDPAHGFTGDCLQDPDYRAFVLRLRDRGFEIALHGVRSGDSPRGMIEDGLRRFEEILGCPPAIHVNHARNRDNVHWGNAWLPLRRRLLGKPDPAQDFEGDVERSPHFWGDLLAGTMRYVRGRTFRHIDTLAIDPYMPYHLPRFPFVDRWFSSSDGADADRFAALLCEENLDRLEEGGGACIVYTHFASGFVDGEGRVREDIGDALRRVAARPGWFAPVSGLLDHLAGGRRRVLRPWQELRIRRRARAERRR